MADTPASRKAIDFYNWLEDNLGVACVDLQRAVYYAICESLGASGDFYFVPDNSNAVYATTPTSMQVKLSAGLGFMNAVPVYVPSVLTSLTLVAPDSNPRIDVLAVDADTRAIVMFTGEQNASPVAPTVTGNRIAVAQIYHRVGETTIEDVDDSTNAYITNLYTFNGTFTDTDTTPSIAGNNTWNTPWTVAAPYEITTFDGGYAGKEIMIIGRNADCVVKKGSNLKMSADWTATPYCSLTLRHGGANWIEKSRSANS
jgi:hypothetical protein